MRHREVTWQPGQDVRDALGVVLWHTRLDDGAEVIVRAVRVPVPAARVEVWRAGRESAAVVPVTSILGLVSALIGVPRALARAA